MKNHEGQLNQGQLGNSPRRDDVQPRCGNYVPVVTSDIVLLFNFK